MSSLAGVAAHQQGESSVSYVSEGILTGTVGKRLCCAQRQVPGQPCPVGKWKGVSTGDLLLRYFITREELAYNKYFLETVWRAIFFK